jgi:sugar phosphate isomerase/epimerase
MIYHVHAKDARIEEGLFQVQGLLDTQPIEAYATRSWNYVALGYGHDLSWWKEFFSVLAMVGYDGPISLEMEDMTMDQITGVTKSIELLKAAMPRCWE